MNTDGREVVNLNREWTYQRGDHPGAERTDYDDSAWEHIGLPHSFRLWLCQYRDAIRTCRLVFPCNFKISEVRLYKPL